MSENNYSLGMPTFIPVGSDPIAIQDLKVQAENLELNAGDVQLFTINADAESDLNFSWIPTKDVAAYADYGMTEEGWFDTGNFCKADYTLKAGEGIMVNNGTESEGVSIKLPNPME